MRREGHIIERVAELDNLLMAFYRAQRGKVCKEEVKRYRAGLMANLNALHEALLQGRVEVGRYRTFTIHDPKERTICAAAFGERVLHHALMAVCHSVFERHLICHTYATRLGKGTYAALDYAHRACGHYRFVSKLDVRKYFDSIHHEILKHQLARIFKDRRLLAVLGDIIDSYETAPGRGLPIGNLTSQYFANHYLSGLDHYVKERLGVKAYVRYMDDMLLFGDDRAVLAQAVSSVVDYCRQRLLVELKPPLIVAVCRGVTFLGYKLQGHRIGLTCRSRNRFRHRMGLYGRLLDDGRWTEEEYYNHITPLLAFVRQAYTLKLRKRTTCEVTDRRAPTALSAAAAGTTTPGTAACRTATTTTRRTATTTSACGWCLSLSLTPQDAINRPVSGFRPVAERNERLRAAGEPVLVGGTPVPFEGSAPFTDFFINKITPP